MKSTIYNPGQPQKREDLNHQKFSIQDAISDRIVELYSPGVLKNSQLISESIPFKLTTGGGLFINVGTGSLMSSGLVDSSDSTETGGERIHIPASEVVAGQNYRRFDAGAGTGNGTGPFAESTDGLGSYIATPQSTLTRLIPLTDTSTNYIWIGYINAIDPAIYSLHKLTSGRIYPKGLDGYDIVVTTTAAVPIFNGNANYHLLGTVVTSGGVVTSVDQSGMVFARTRSERVGINIDTSSPPATYADGETKFLDDHVNAMGSGSGPSASNPHNQKLEDFGVAAVDFDLVQHRRDHHTSGIVGDVLAITSSLNSSTDPATPDPSPAVAMVYSKQLISGESVVVAGEVYTEVLPKLSVPVGGGAIGDAYVSFLNTDPADTYFIYVTISGGQATLLKSTIVPAGSLAIGSVDWDGATFSSGITDLRTFGLTGAKDIQNDSVTDRKLAAGAVTTSKILDGAVALSKMGLNSVDAPNIVSQAVTTAKLDALSVTESKLGSSSVTTSKLGADAVTEPNIANDAVDSRQVNNADGTSGQDTATGSGIKTAHIQDEAVTTPKLDAGLQTSFVPTGVLMPFAGLEISAPTGWVVCDGRVLDGSLQVNASLFASIGTLWGGSGFLFKVPDLRGSFLRGVNTTTTGTAADLFSDPDEGSRTERDGVSPASGVGSYQQDEFGSHSHTDSAGGNNNGSGGGGAAAAGFPGVTGPSGGSETRPTNAYVLYIIKL